ncbi:MAG: UDP-N-acetylmuramoyl-L-alanine--D-glutamate ligase [Gallionella sp.]|nr:UDP-N-acetylmuramoyl-L-alanine--D-glutamate ligase [Gallionella sp.]
MKIWSDKLVLVLGLGETGLSMLRYLSAQGARLRAADSRSAPAGLSEAAKHVAAQQLFCGAFQDSIFDDIDLIAISPGVPLADPVVARAVARGIPVVGDIELFAQRLAACDLRLRPKVIAITGSNGKTTVTSMVAHLCKSAGKDVLAAGNISPAVLDMMMRRGAQQPDVWVLELSSFQLETTSTLHADAATVLNVTEDHLDRYDGMDDYAAAKARVLIGCGVQVLNRDDGRSMGMARAGIPTITFGLNPPQPSLVREGEIRTALENFGIVHEAGDIWLMQGAQRLIRASELQLSGLHNVANALAALALCRAIGLEMPLLLAGLRSFKGLPHRVEKVAEIAGVTYYDDSKGTNVGATVAALRGLGKRAVVILGGEGKGQDFGPLNAAVKSHARAVVLIGRDAGLIASALQGCDVNIARAADMADAVRQASALAQANDAVLLSPACASFDMFRNYEHRAQVFIAAVEALILPSASPWSGGEAVKEGAWPR